MGHILALTLNPSVDRTLTVDSIQPGGETRVKAVRFCAGGKGVNVARALTALGIKVRSLTLNDIVPVPARINITLVEASGRVTRFLEPGPEVTVSQWGLISAAVLRAASRADLVVVSGSFPPGLSKDACGQLLYRIHRAGRKTALDTSGPALASGIKAAPWCVKPNREEAEAFLGQRIRSRAAVRKALKALAGYGIRQVLLSLGEEGLAGYDGQEMLIARAPVEKGITVGCGDAALAGFVSLRHQPFRQALAWAAACGAVNVGKDISGNISRKQVRSLLSRVKIITV